MVKFDILLFESTKY